MHHLNQCGIEHQSWNKLIDGECGWLFDLDKLTNISFPKYLRHIFMIVSFLLLLCVASTKKKCCNWHSALGKKEKLVLFLTLCSGNSSPSGISHSWKINCEAIRYMNTRASVYPICFKFYLNNNSFLYPFTESILILLTFVSCKYSLWYLVRLQLRLALINQKNFSLKCCLLLTEIGLLNVNWFFEWKIYTLCKH